MQKVKVPDARIEKTRGQFRQLLVANPNYFGSLVKSDLASEDVAGNTKYEELTSLGYEPAKTRLEATFDIRLAFGYKGDLCSNGSTEYVRFYVDHGSGWQDAGVAATAVHNIPNGEDCEGDDDHPISYTVGVDYAPKARWCLFPQLPRVRAILSWELEPPPGQPDWIPPWGNVAECHIQIRKGFGFFTLVDALMDPVLKLPPGFIDSLPVTQDPVPVDPLLLAFTAAGDELVDPEEACLDVTEPKSLTLSERAEQYRGESRFEVEPHRFGFSELHAIASSSDLSPEAIGGFTQSFAELDLDLGKLLFEIDDTKGNVNYEELEDLGLDTNLEQLVASFRVKLGSGYSGGLCSAGSTEYVAFWADWGDECDWTYLGTAEVDSYDFGERLPDDGLCYSAILPVDLNEVRRPCEEAGISRVRAVLSWNAPPSTVDPDAVPVWGNRLDAHVQVRPGTPHSFGPIMTVVGGISVAQINNVTGLTTPGAKFVDNGLDADSLGRPCPFAQRIVIRGPSFPGNRYRVQVREVGSIVWTTLTKKIWVTPVIGLGSYHTIDPDGWFTYLPFAQNFAGILSYFESAGDAQWDIRLEIEGVFGAALQRVQLDSTVPTAAIAITSGTGDCGTFSPGTTISGIYTATDTHMRSYSLGVSGHPSANTPSPSSGNVNTVGAAWSLNTTGMVECGYVISVHVRDRTIRNSIYNGWPRTASIGFCIREDE